MLYDLSKSNPYDREKFTARVKEMLDKGEVVNLSRHHPSRSNQQNKYYWLLLGYFGAELGYNMDDVKSIFKWTVNPDIFVRVKENKMGKQVQYTRSSAELDTAEMSLAITRFRNYSSAEAGVYLPSADEHQFLLHCEKRIAEEKEFIQQD